MPIAVQCEYAIGRAVIDDGIGIERGGNPAERLVSLQIEHDDHLIVARGRESMPRGLRDRRTVRALNAGYLAEQRSVILVHHHDAGLARDEYAVIRRIGHDVVPASV